jgi:predicted O-methyltransferase YrrM
MPVLVIAGTFQTVEAVPEPQGRMPRLFRGKRDRAYLPSYDVPEERLATAQKIVSACLTLETCRMRPEDGLKLYELAFFGSGPVLEIGTFHGNSATIIASALSDAVRDVEFVSVDIEERCQKRACAELAVQGLADRVALFHGTCEDLFAARPDFRPMLVFVDGDHSRDGVRRDIEALNPHVPNGALLLFHDYLDDRNGCDPAYGVPDAIAGTWIELQCAFGGTFGCCGLFRRQEGGPDAAAAATHAAVADRT